MPIIATAILDLMTPEVAPVVLMDQEMYVACLGNECPRCGSREIYGDPLQADGDTAWCGASCSSCGLEWKDLYKLVGYEVRK